MVEGMAGQGKKLLLWDPSLIEGSKYRYGL